MEKIQDSNIQLPENVALEPMSIDETEKIVGGVDPLVMPKKTGQSGNKKQKK